MSNPKKVYFAGKVTREGYRQKLLNNSDVMSRGCCLYEINGGKLVYGGPFALRCDHGCFHSGSSHAMGILLDREDYPACEGYFYDEHEERVDFSQLNHGMGMSEPDAVNRCLRQIRECDAVHAFLDSFTCYGTLSELGYASATGKPIYITLKGKSIGRWKSRLWFIFNLPGVVCCELGDEASIHPDLLTFPVLVPTKSRRQLYHEYLMSPEWAGVRTAKLEEAEYRCQVCNTQHLAGEKALNVHHRTYERIFHEMLGDLVVLCPDCHEIFHAAGKLAKIEKWINP